MCKCYVVCVTSCDVLRGSCAYVYVCINMLRSICGDVCMNVLRCRCMWGAVIVLRGSLCVCMNMLGTDCIEG